MIEDLALWKREMRARLAAARSGLLASLLGLSQETLESEVIAEGLTATQALALTAHEDRTRAAAVEETLGGGEKAFSAHAAADLSLPFEEALDHMLHARAALLSAFARVPDELFQNSAREAEMTRWLEESAADDQHSVDRIAEWRASRRVEDAVGPIELLIAAIRAARKELLTEVACLPEEARPEGQIGARTLRDALLDVVVWECEMSSGLAGYDSRASSPRAGSDSWHATWRALHDGHQAVLRQVQELSTEDLARATTGPWPGDRTIYDLLRYGVGLDRHVAASIRSSLLS